MVLGATAPNHVLAAVRGTQVAELRDQLAVYLRMLRNLTATVDRSDRSDVEISETEVVRALCRAQAVTPSS